MKKSKKVKKSDFLTLTMMQMSVEVEERAHYQREKVIDWKQLTEVIARIMTGYFATSGGRKKRKIQKN